MGAQLSSLFYYLKNVSYFCCSNITAHESISEESISESEDEDHEYVLEDKKILFTQDSKKRALLIGINYFNTNSELSGCINDVIHLKEFLSENLYFDSKDILCMRDDYDFSNYLYPSYFNIINQIDLLVEWANNNRNSEIWFSYSGHGSNIIDYSGDELDNRDEVLCTVDNKYIKDDWLKTNFINLLNKDVKLFILIDACHSATMCDLNQDLNKKIIMISGCKDNQTSADAYIREEQEYRGALSYNFMNAWQHSFTMKEFHEKMCSQMYGKYTQSSICSYTNASLLDYHLC